MYLFTHIYILQVKDHILFILLLHVITLITSFPPWDLQLLSPPEPSPGSVFYKTVTYGTPRCCWPTAQAEISTVQSDGREKELKSIPPSSWELAINLVHGGKVLDPLFKDKKPTPVARSGNRIPLSHPSSQPCPVTWRTINTRRLLVVNCQCLPRMTAIRTS